MTAELIPARFAPPLPRLDPSSFPDTLSARRSGRTPRSPGLWPCKDGRPLHGCVSPQPQQARSAAISRHFERDPIPYALETDWPVGAAGFEPLHIRIGICQDSQPGAGLELAHLELKARSLDA